MNKSSRSARTKNLLNLAVVILAAGEGKRMKSRLPKVLHSICGRPMIEYVLDLANGLKPQKILAVIGPNREMFSAFEDKVQLVVQEKPLGTAYTVLTTQPFLRNFQGEVLIICGDTPLIKIETLQELIKSHLREKAALTLLTTLVKEPKGYGRIIRTSRGEVEKIVEEKEASEEERKTPEINAGVYLFNREDLFAALPKVGSANKQGEFYLTDTIEILKKRKRRIQAFQATDEKEILGVNSRKELAYAEKILRESINSRWMEQGVTLTDPNSTFIDAEVTIGKDTIIYPFSFLEGKTSVGANSKLGPLVRLVDTKVGRNVEIQNSVVNTCVIEDEVLVGPFSHLRPGTRVKKGAKVGTFVEIKKSEIGKKSKVPHLSYIGDTTIGKEVNIGAGTITCNYNGYQKYRTIIEDYAFIGSDTQLVAPVKIGKKAVTGAGSTITENVPEKSLALERTEQKIIKDWAEKRSRKARKTRNNKGKRD